MEGNRRYADEPESHWYAGNKDPYDSGVPERPSGAFRLPDQNSYPEQRTPETGPAESRPAESYGPPPGYAVPDPLTPPAGNAYPSSEPPPARTTVRGAEYPPVRPAGAPAPRPSDPAERQGETAHLGAEPTAVVPSVADSAAEAVYRSRRPTAALIITAAAGLLMIPVLVLLVRATFVDVPTAPAIVPAVLLTTGLPLAAAGLHALAASGPQRHDAWLRPPLAYLPIGLLMLVAAGLAVG